LSLSNYVALSFPGGENLNVFPSIHRSSFLALILFCCWDPKDMNSQLFFFTLHWNHNRRRNIYLLAFRELTLIRVEE
jgi:hypothetical protein